MQDLQEIRAHPDQVRAALARRGIEPPIETLLALDSDRRALLTQVEQLKAERNRVSKEIGQMKDASGREVRIGEMRTIGQHIEALDVSVREKETALHELLAGLPNVPDADVPDGADETLQCRRTHRRRAEALRLRAAPALGPRAGARHPGFRPRGQADRFAVLRPERRRGALAARADRLDARPAHAPGLPGEVHAIRRA